MKYLKVAMVVMAVAGLAMLAGCSSDPTTNCTLEGQRPTTAVPNCCTGLIINASTGLCEKCAAKGTAPTTGQVCCEGQVNGSTGLCDSCLKAGAECSEGEEGAPACCEGSSPSAGAYCNDSSVCATCSHFDGDCKVDADCCPLDDPALICKDLKCAKICKSDKDCTDASKPTCIQGECVPPACSSDADCSSQKCCSGACKADCGYGTADKCTITSTGGVVAVTKTVALKAVGIKGDLTKDGQIVPGTTILWTSSVPSVATVDAAGLLTGVAAGKTVISAKVGSTDCSNTITFTVLAPVVGSVNVYVYNSATGAPIENAMVKVGAVDFKATDANGLAGFLPGDDNGTVHVAKNGFTWISYVGTAKGGYVVFLDQDTSGATKGGYKGKFDYSPIKKDDQLHAGIAAMSVNGNNLYSLNVSTLIGEMIQTPINISSPATVKQCIALPGGLVAGSNYLKVPDLIPEFRILGDGGLKAAWGLGTVLNTGDITDLLKILSPIISGGSIDIGKILAAALPLVANFNHAVQSALNVNLIPTVTTPNITCPDGKVVPLVDSATMADYANFKSITLKLAAKMALSSVITVADVPKFQGNCLSGIAAISGADVAGIGLIPLGLSAGMTPEGGKICKITYPKDANPFSLSDGTLMLKMAPNHDGMEGNDYMFAMLSLDFDQIGDNTPMPISGRIVLGEKQIKKTYDWSAKTFITFPEGTSLTRGSRTIKAATAAVAGAKFYRYMVTGAGSWFVYTDKTATDIVLPAAPAGTTDVVTTDATMMIHSINTIGTETLGDLFSS
ncbi:MAG: Ig-like domain-containing protein, partial [Myxococcota bacterium]